MSPTITLQAIFMTKWSIVRRPEAGARIDGEGEDGGGDVETGERRVDVWSTIDFFEKEKLESSLVKHEVTARGTD